MTPPPGSASYFAQLSRDLMSHQEEPTIVERVAQTALQVVASATAAGVVRWRVPGVAEVAHTTGEPATTGLRLQQELHEGPALDVLEDPSGLLAADLLTTSRWQGWTPHLTALGCTGVLAVRLDAPDEVVGTLVLYASEGQFSDQDAVLASVYAAHATNAILAARTAEELRAEMAGRHSLGIAQGILMQAHDLPLEQAHEVLHRHAAEQGTDVSVVAEHVLAHGTLPEEAP